MPNTFENHIIVPTDFSEQSLIALGQSYNLARFTKSDITLVHVMDEDLFTSLRHVFNSDEEQEKLMRLGIQTKLDQLANETRAKSGIEVKTCIEKGKIYDEINRLAKELNAAFIIMGTDGKSTLRKKFIGSNARKVIDEAPCPVITIKGKEHRQGCKTILLPLDLSRETKEKVDECIEIAKFFGSAVKVMTVVDTRDEFLVNKLRRQLDQVVDFLSSHNIATSGEFIHGDDIAEEVLKYAEKVKADLIIIMTQQELVWTEYFIGTASQKIINESTIPVCSIRPQERKNTTEFVIS